MVDEISPKVTDRLENSIKAHPQLQFSITVDRSIISQSVLFSLLSQPKITMKAVLAICLLSLALASAQPAKSAKAAMPDKSCFENRPEVVSIETSN